MQRERHDVDGRVEKSGGPIAAVLYPRARSTLYVNPVPYPRVTYIFARTWVHTRPGRAGWKFDGT